MSSLDYIDSSTIFNNTPTWLRKVKTAHSRPDRYYHTLTHINDLLRLLSEHRHRLDNAKCVELAIFFHDVVYDPKATEVGSNERRSNEIFLQYVFDPSANLDEDEVTRVSAMILATIHHQPPLWPNDDLGALEDLKFFLDIDMSILAADETRYDEYATAIRKEYGHYTELAYNSGRKKVLTNFLEREGIYFSGVLAGSGMEERARLNIRREIEKLQACI